MSTPSPRPAPASNEPQDPPRRPSAPRDAACPALDSQTLLKGGASVAIHHQGVVYRLQATRLGKLILTK